MATPLSDGKPEKVQQEAIREMQIYANYYILLISGAETTSARPLMLGTHLKQSLHRLLQNKTAWGTVAVEFERNMKMPLLLQDTEGKLDFTILYFIWCM